MRKTDPRQKHAPVNHNFVIMGHRYVTSGTLIKKSGRGNAQVQMVLNRPMSPYIQANQPLRLVALSCKTEPMKHACDFLAFIQPKIKN